MTAPELPGVTPSPFDPTPWPPWDRVAAAGLGELYGAMVREFDSQIAVDSFDPVTWAMGHIEAAKQQGTITANDATRLTALIAPSQDATTAAGLFDEAMSDPTSSPIAIGILSIARYKEQHATTDEPIDVAKGFVAGLSTMAWGAPGLAVIAAEELALHVHVSVTIT